MSQSVKVSSEFKRSEAICITHLQARRITLQQTHKHAHGSTREDALSEGVFKALGLSLAFINWLLPASNFTHL